MLSRREFIAHSLVAAGAVLAAPPLMHRIAEAANLVSSGPGAPILVVVQLLGGNDGLNTVIPYSDARYNQARPHIGIPSKEVLTLEQGLALNPAMKSLFPIWSAGHLALVQNVGYPNPIRSHFESMDIWNTANVERPVGDGWLGRYVNGSLQGKVGTLSAVGIGNSLPAMLRSSAATLTCLEGLRLFQLVTPRRGAGGTEEDEHTILELYANSNLGSYGDLLSQTVQAAFDTSKTLQQIAQTYQTKADYPRGQLGDSLKLAAQILTHNLGTRVVHISLGGFDTHTNEKPQQARLLQELSDGLSAFYQDLEGHGLGDQVVTMTVSEFGRRVAENASGGTDHGAASCLFVVGNKVKGGIYGGAPNLEDLDHGDLKHTVDFRSIYATMIRDLMGTDPIGILDNSFPTLPFISNSGADRTEKGILEYGPTPRRSVLLGLASQLLRHAEIGTFPD